MRIELVGQADAVGLDEEKEILSVAGQGDGTTLHDPHQGQLFVGDLQRLVGLVAVLEHDFEAVVAAPGIEAFDLGRSGQEWGGDPLAFL